MEKEMQLKLQVLTTVKGRERKSATQPSPNIQSFYQELMCAVCFTGVLRRHYGRCVHSAQRIQTTREEMSPFPILV